MRYPDWNGEIPPLFKPTTLAEFRAKLVPRVNNSDSGSTHNVEDTKQGDIGSGTVNHGGLSKGGIVAIVRHFNPHLLIINRSTDAVIGPRIRNICRICRCGCVVAAQEASNCQAEEAVGEQR